MNTDSVNGETPRGALEAGQARAIIVTHSKSFSLASLLLGRTTRTAVERLYAYCRRADDAIDLAAPDEHAVALERLRSELVAVYAAGPEAYANMDPVAAGFHGVAWAYRIPREYPAALLEGLTLDATGKGYATLDELLHYCWCVAGSVGAMMCHVLGVTRQRALVHGVHLGMAMQLTNICRDVAEDWERGRLYLPRELLPEVERCGPLPPRIPARALSRAVEHLSREANALYRSGAAGLGYLPLRARFAVAVARRLYSAIGDELAERRFDTTLGRARVPGPRKIQCVAQAALDTLLAGPVSRRRPASLRLLRFPVDVLPL
jgi:phytoene synthase